MCLKFFKMAFIKPVPLIEKDETEKTSPGRAWNHIFTNCARIFYAAKQSYEDISMGYNVQ